MDKVKKLARRVSSLHQQRPSQIEKATQDVPPLPPKPATAGKQSKDIVLVAASQPVREWDQGIFQLSLIRHDIYPRDLSTHPEATNESKISEGSFKGMQKAMTQAYNLIENRYATYSDAVNVEPSLPQYRNLEECRQLYQYKLPDGSNDPSDPDKHPYPPCWDIIPPKVRVGQFFGANHLFDHMRLLDTASILLGVIPEKMLDWLHDHPERDTFEGIREREQTLRRKRADIYNDSNIGDRQDWYTDAVLVQQQFT